MYGTASPGYSYGSPYGSKSRLDISQIPPSARSNFLVRSSKVKLVKFRAKASLRGGVTLRAAETNVPLANQTRYTFYDLKVDDRSKIKLRMMWTGYKTLTYDIPVDGHGGRVDLQTLLRRVARACRHYLEKNRIPLSWERVKIQHLEEVALGTWQPLLVTY
ncbi:hypothetical protein PUNSTDRAFT_51396 [Punctularia strigosozonata HHB-11173 SS5]|uniref:uncharacterized protein n=1 Tax=Punctularia strigosozonata (strain HHB-11173) TaxID=741275 RepID=UPI00044182FF|nr:uncharacterized protein PUNSTDRAFT_51396 [Punctularia strigosozonata HHB-11173 SS5]EIN10822.1 hypothetical protein PUNSTDRAFT_51396 [Punctularia strigosozonata HHB-11173 SS5]